MNCTICPRECGADRTNTAGFCGVLSNPVVSRYGPHMWEEPPISGARGSGTVFFAGCNLRCVFCQNHKISQARVGKEITVGKLAEILLELESNGVHNINLVTPTHFAPQIATALEIAKKSGLKLPVVYNSGGYEKTETLKLLGGLIDVYLPDIKYFDDDMALKYSDAPGYFDAASEAVLEMHRQVPDTIFDDSGIILRGIIIRHLILPGARHDSMRILDWIKLNVPDAYVSILSQYVPLNKADGFKELNRHLTTFEYNSVVEHFFKIGLENGFMQDRKSAVTDYIPDFNSFN